MVPFCPQATGMEIIAHRGAMTHAPENTLASQRLAYELGVDIVEIDVRLSKDGVPVIIHDHTLERTTSGTGLVTALTLQQLKQLDAGAWFGPQFAGERIPTLAEMLEVAKQYNRKVILDIKGDLMAPAVVAVIQQSGIPLEQITILTWWEAMTAGYTSRLPGVKIMCPPLSAATGATLNLDQITAADFANLHRQKVTGLFLGTGDVTRSAVRKVHAAGFRASVIYVHQTTAFSYQDMGVDQFWTDFSDVTVTSHKRMCHQWTNWAESMGLPPDQRRTWQDTDGDGANNLTEYALGTNPVVQEPPRLFGEGIPGSADSSLRITGAETVDWTLDLRENWSQFLNVSAQSSDGSRWTNLPASCCTALTPARLEFKFPTGASRKYFRLKFDLKQ